MRRKVGREKARRNREHGLKIELKVKATPYPQPRPRVSRGHAYEPKRITDYKNEIRNKARSKMKNKEALSGLVRVEITLHRDKRLGSRSYGDIDNHVKAVLDALNGICYRDDAQVVKLAAEKKDTKEEYVEIIVTDELEE